MLRPVQAARTLSTRNLSGITLYKPQELILSARAGTPLPEIEAALAERGQHLIAEPPDPGALFGATPGAPATLGGVVATNLSGPRRISSGAIRDHVMGIRAVTGTGEVFRSGGRVLKNVTGLDLCKLLAGSHGTLGVLTEITLKVLPAPERSATVALRVPDLAAGVRALSAGLGSPYGVSGAALLPDGNGVAAGPLAILRIEDFAESVVLPRGPAAGRAGAARRGGPDGGRRKAATCGAGCATSSRSAPSRATRCGACPCARPPGLAWRRRRWARRRRRRHPARAARLGRRAGLDRRPAHRRGARRRGRRRRGAGNGAFALFRAPDSLRAAVAVLPDEPAPLAAIGRRVKAALDPAGVLNPGTDARRRVSGGGWAGHAPVIHASRRSRSVDGAAGNRREAAGIGRIGFKNMRSKS